MSTAFDASGLGTDSNELTFTVAAGSSEGLVLGAASEEPVAADSVQLFDERGGLYDQVLGGGATLLFDDILVGTYTMRVSAPGFAGAEQSVTVSAHEERVEIAILLGDTPSTPSRTPTPVETPPPPPPVELRLIVDISTTVPSATGVFTTFGEYAVEATRVVFTALGGGTGGIYVDEIGRGLIRVADGTIITPGESQAFRNNFFALSIDEGVAAFSNLRTEEDLWVADIPGGSALTRIDLSAVAGRGNRPELANQVIELFGVTFETGALAFGATLFDYPSAGIDSEAIYMVDDPLDPAAAARVVADVTTAIPGGTGTFQELPSSRPVRSVAMAGSMLVFVGIGSGAQQGVYLHDPGDVSVPIRVVADTTTEVPAGAGTFTEFCGVSTDGGGIAFRGRGTSGEIGVYASVGGALVRIADATSAIPGRSDAFRAFGCVTAIEGTTVVFEADRPGFPVKRGAYVSAGGAPVKVVDSDDELGAKIVQRAELGDHESLHAGRLVTLVWFTGGSSGLYLAEFE